VLLFVVLACVPPLALVLLGPESERQLASEVPLALAMATTLYNPCVHAEQLARDRTSPWWEL
jgi:hypothetical protein